MMAKIYARKIRDEVMGIDEVPLRWRAEVEELLKEEGGN